MARIDLKNKVVHAKLVYYGPGLCGKTANLEYVAKTVAAGQELMSLSTEGDRTIFFDFLPLGIGKVRGLDVQFKLYTVPGQVRYNETRKMVLKNVDAVVFVADSQPMMMDGNLDSIDDLFLNLRELAIDDRKIPILLQYNKRDLPGVLTREELDLALNARAFPTFLASAKTGEGVIETLNGISQMLLYSLRAQLMEAPADAAAPASARMAAAAPAAAAPAAAAPASAARPVAPPPAVRPIAPPVPAAAAPAAAPRAPAPPVARQEAPGGPSASRNGPTAGAPPKPGAGDGAAAAPAAGPSRVNGDTVAGGAAPARPGMEDTIRTLLAESNHVLGALKEHLGALRSTKAGGDDGGTLKALLEPIATKGDVHTLARRLDGLAATSAGDKRPASPDLGSKGQELNLLRVSVSEIGKNVTQGLSSLQSNLGALDKRVELLPSRSDVEGLLASVSNARAPAVPEGLATKEDLAALNARLDRLATKSDVEELRRMTSELLAQLKGLAPKRAAAPVRPPAPASTPPQGDAVAKTPPGVEASEPVPESRAAHTAPTVGPPAVAAVTIGPPSPEEPPIELKPPRMPSGTSPAVTIPEPIPPAAASPVISEPPPALADEAPAAAAPVEATAPRASVAAPPAPPANEAPAASAADPTPTPPAATVSGEPTTDIAVVAEAAPPPPAAEEATEAPKPAEPAPDVAKPAEPIAAAASPSPAAAPEPPPDDPRHQNAARVARVMVADLYLYAKEAVETGIRQGDFFERNKEALGDIRATYEQRIPSDVRDEFDHLDRAIQDFIGKKKKQWGLE